MYNVCLYCVCVGEVGGSVWGWGCTWAKNVLVILFRLIAIVLFNHKLYWFRYVECGMCVYKCIVCFDILMLLSLIHCF